ncbi:MAG: GTP 3',8-cyclase MoaA [Tepidisphaeraceae bacterium]
MPIIERSYPWTGHFGAGPTSIGSVRVLRISITDRCNYRCVYCMPEDGVTWLPKPEILSFEEIARVVKAAIQIHGIRRFKLTGGEPTVRNGLVELVALLKRIDGVEDLSLTTNGQRLAELAGPLRAAGLDRVTVSIDSLDPARFRLITRTGDLATVLAGLDRAEEVGFASIKINCVTMRGINEDELADFARLTVDRKLTVRFIEYMPLGEAAIGPAGGQGFALRTGVEAKPSTCDGQSRGDNALISETETRGIIERELGPLTPVNRPSEAGVGPANVWRLSRGRPLGRIGFISAMSAPFCATCNRLRLTADGLLRSCLFDGGEIDVKSILRGQDPSLQSLADAMVQCVRLKPSVHSHHGNKQMSRIGG